MSLLDRLKKLLGNPATAATASRGTPTAATAPASSPPGPVEPAPAPAPKPDDMPSVASPAPAPIASPMPADIEVAADESPVVAAMDGPAAESVPVAAPEAVAPATESIPEPLAPPPIGSPDGKERRAKLRVNARPGTRVLIIDDSPTIVALLGRMLKQNHLEVFEAGDAEQGLALARDERPELIFLDIVLPGMNGFTALRHLRRDPLTKDTPIIMISGNEQATEQFYVQRIGADDFMKKPFSRAEVFARIEHLLDAELVPRRKAAAPAPSPAA